MKDRRLIEAGFPLKQVSLDSVHEKNVRHGHISTLHIWPARRKRNGFTCWLPRAGATRHRDFRMQDSSSTCSVDDAIDSVSSLRRWSVFND